MPQRLGVVGWCDGRASYNLDIIGQGPIALAVGAVGGCLDIFTLLCFFSSLSGGGRVVRRGWVNFQCRDVLLICGVVGWCDGAG